MNIKRLITLISLTNKQAVLLDVFVECQRDITRAVRKRDWAGLEQALEKAGTAADAVQKTESDRQECWYDFLCESGLPDNSSVFRASLVLPVEYRSGLNDAYRALRLSAMRARIENDSLSSFVGSSADTLRQAIESIFPERKGRIYGKSGKTAHSGSSALVLDTAL